MPHANDLYLVQWSEHDRHFHTEAASSALAASVQDFLAGIEDDYITLAIVKTPDEAQAALEALAKKRGLKFNEAELKWELP